MAETNAATTEESIQKAEYEVPLSPAELLDLGRATSILSQIDFMLTEALSSASKTPAWAAYIFADRAAMSARIGMLDSITGGNRERDKVIAVSSASEFFSFSRSASAAARDAGLSERFGF